ncbi:MAG: shikimate dehydrogenase [Bacteroidales bacterium]|jgi:shikimate dehydrogenase|nr:shikimate dehydrogenase [Bacteroidales bacterium]
MKEFGLIGYPLGHAYSQKYFENKFRESGIEDVKYTLFPISEINKITNIISSHKNLCGLNVTTPYKELVIPYLHDMDPLIIKLGTVNVISIDRDNDSYTLKGYNTDVYGLEKTFKELDLPAGCKALILGSGGSGKTCAYVLEKMNIPYTVVSRNPLSLKQLAYNDITEATIKNHNLIINASPVGMYPNIGNCPYIPYNFIGDEHTCFDLVYNPAETLFLKKCSDAGARTMNGLTMLYEQADMAWKIWNKTEKECLLEI